MELYFWDVFWRRALTSIFLLWTLTYFTEGVPDITCTSNKARSNNTEKLYLTSYISGGYADATVTFDLEAFTGTGFALPGTTLPANATAGFAARRLLPSDVPGSERVGVFNCQAQNDGVTESIVIIVLSKNAIIVPASQTQTTSIGDDVSLQVTTSSSSKLEWRKDGVELNLQNSFQLAIPITSANSTDAGIYECYGNKERSSGQGAIIRLIVRACHASKWGPPSCLNDCQVCYNGGVCDDEAGDCVCAPGFSGASCQNVHGSNHFGQDGMLQCYYGADSHDNSCQGQLFCLPDPYGCSCASGFQGIDCLEECPEGTYGADCKQTCHCAAGETVCLKDTGECKFGGCEAGWTGVNCQVPDPCPDDYVGDLCELKCNCPSSQTCNAKDGLATCIGCVSAASAPADVRSTSLSSTSVKFTWSPVQCSESGTDIDLYEYRLENQVDFGEFVLDTGEISGTEVIITGLTPCVNYTFSVAAKTGATAVYSDELVITTETEVPGMITGLKVTQKDPPENLHISWISPTSACSATQYVVEYRLNYQDQCPVADTSVTIQVVDTSVILVGLQPHSTYGILVSGINDAGSGILMQAFYGTPQSVPSSPPDSVSDTAITSTSLSFSWSEVPCGSRGGSSRGYSYRLINEANQNEVTGNTRNLYVTLSGLMACAAYSFSVAGVTSMGTGQYSEELQVTTSVAAPVDAPLAVTVTTFSADSVTFSWTEFSVTCDNPLADIQAYYYKLVNLADPQDVFEGLGLSTSLSATVSGLRSCAEYNVRLAVGNSLGRGPYNEGTIATTDVSVPGSIHGLSLPGQINPDHVLISWQQPSRSCPATSFVLELVISHRDLCQSDNQIALITTTNTSVVLSNLSDYSSFHLTITPENGAGKGPIMDLYFGTAETVPKVAPVNVTIEAVTATSLRFTWAEIPCLSRGGEIKKYLYKARNVGDTSDVVTGETLSNSATVTGLAPCSIYTFQVAARTNIGVGVYSEIFTAPITFTAVPSEVISLSASEPSNTTLVISWQTPISSCMPTEYVIVYTRTNKGQCHVANYNSSNELVVGNVNEVILSGLLPYSSYVISVHGRNSVGDGPNVSIDRETAGFVPGRVVDLSVTSQSPTELQVSWQPPTTSCVSTRYRVEYTFTNQDQCAAMPAIRRTYGEMVEASVGMTGLVPYSTYIVYVTARNDAGDAPAASEVGTTSETSAPTGLTVIISTSDSLSFSWGEVACGNRGGQIQQYHYQLTATMDSRDVANMMTSDSNVKIAGLVPCSSYRFTVSAVNNAGEGPSTDLDAETADSAPSVIQNLTVTSQPSGDVLQLSWQPPSGICPPDSYRIEYQLTNLGQCQVDTTTRKLTSGVTSSTSHSVEGLSAYSTYSLFVTAINVADDSPESVISTTTAETAPSSPPVNVSVSSADILQLDINWQPPSCGSRHGPILSYAYKLTDTSDESEMTGNTTSTWVVFSNLTGGVEYAFVVSARTSNGFGPFSDPVIQGVDVLVDNTSPGPSETPTVASNFSTSTPSNMTSPSDSLTTSAPSNLTSPSGIFSTSASSSMTSPSDNVTTSAPFNMTSLSDNITTGVPATITSPSGNLTTSAPSNTTLPTPTVNDASGLPNVTFPDSTSIFSPTIIPGVPMGISSPSSSVNSIIVQWSPPELVPGSLITYAIRYWKTSEGEESVVTIPLEEDFGDGLVFAYNITSLESSTSYSFQVRAESFAGASLWSDTVTAQTESEYPAVSNLMVVSKTQTTLRFKWGPPSEGVGDIQAYTVDYKAIFKPYEINFLPGDLIAHTAGVPDPACTDCQTTVSGLEPSTQYQVHVTAQIASTFTRVASLTTFTSVANGFPFPAAPKLNVGESTKTRIVIILPAVESKYVSGFQVGVRKAQNRNKRADTPVFGSADNSPNAYVAGEVGRADTEFSVGNNATYGSHKNPPLTEGQKYDIYAAYVSRTSDDATVVWSDPLTVTAGQYEPTVGKKTGSKNALTPTWIAIICGGALLILIIIFFIIFVSCHQNKKRRQSQTIMFENGRADRDLDAFPVDEADGGGRQNRVDLSDEHDLGVSAMISYRSLYSSWIQQALPPDSKPVTSIISLKSIDNGGFVGDNNSPGMTTFSTPQRANGTHANGDALPGIIENELSSPGTKIPVGELPQYVESKKVDPRKGFHIEYKVLPDGKQHEWNVAMTKENQVKNRYSNIVPYDHSRVRLRVGDDESRSDYVNACYINDYKQQKKYIASQGPKDNTIWDFWQMMWECKSTKIVMLTNCVETGKKKCAYYWPDFSKGSTQSFETVTVAPVSLEEYLDYTVRTFHLKKIGDDEGHTVRQFHFTSWPDMGVPQYPTSLLNFRRAVRAYDKDNSTPSVIHCSAGVGRTGTYIAIDTILDQAQDEGMVDIFNFVSTMREQRCKMVQTAEQYQFIYEAVLESVLTKDTSIGAAIFGQQYTDLCAHTGPGNKFPSMEEQFQLLEYWTVIPDVGTCKAATQAENLDKNRFPDRLPSDRVRPFLVTPSSPPCTDYINAVLIPGFRKKNMYIATQMPLAHTIGDIWRLAYDYKSTTIVMLNVMDHSDQTYFQYWPESGSNIYGGTLAVDFESSTKHTDSIMIRTYNMYTIKDSEVPTTTRTIQHFQFLDWYDNKGVPADAHEALLSLITIIDQWQKQSGGGPIIVQCVDGVGCSGVFCALSTILQRLEESMVVDVFQTVKGLRMVRPQMVETQAQFEFLYEAVQHHITQAGPSRL